MQVPIATRRFVFIPMDLQDLSVGLLQVPNKQWGFEETETKTIAFPISFESIKYVFLSKIYGPASGGADTVAYNFFRKSLTGVSFDYAYTRNWLAIGGKQPQWGKYTNSGNDRVITYPIAFSELYYANVISPDNCETFVYGISNTNINYRLCNGYNDDRWNGTQTSRLFAVGR